MNRQAIEQMPPRIEWDTCTFCGADGTGKRPKDTIRHLFPADLAGPQASICDRCVRNFASQLKELGIEENSQ